VGNEKIFAGIVSAAFGQRRKTLRNTLKEFINEDDFALLNIDSKLRAENLSVADFASIAEHMEKR
jgi:16S rRNA (adenine1518-N6/adenine1519-N6)-dimethyltransferase